MLIFVLALAVVLVFALPHLRAGAPVLTPEGERLARGLHRPVRRLTDPLRRRGRDRPDRPAGTALADADPFPMPPALAASPYASPSEPAPAPAPAPVAVPGPSTPASAEPVAEPDRAAGPTAGAAAGPTDDQRMDIDVRWIDAP